MKKILCLILVSVFLFLCGCNKEEPIEIKEEPVNISAPVKGVWIFYNELKDIGKSDEDNFKKKIDKIFDDCVDFGLNSVFVQIRPFADSFYPSKIFPWSKYLSGKQGKGVDYDPLEIMIDSAHERNLEFHGWINPFRISFSTDFDELSDDNPAKKMEGTTKICVVENGIYYNPANLDSQKLILNGIKEIAENYDVDGIHIDDYFYPSTDENIDKYEYNQYSANNGHLSLSEWRIEIINSFVSGLYNCVKNINPEITVSISPAGNINNNYTQLFADVKLWASEEGYCDIIVPQIYFGSESETLTFDEAFSQWQRITDTEKVKLMIGLGAYKAADPETAEWEDYLILERQTDKILEKENISGYCLFSYSSLMSLKKSAESSDNQSGEE